MNKNNKKKLVAITIIAIFTFSVYSGYDATHYPYIMPTHQNLFSGYNSTSYNREVIFKNITPYGNNIQIGESGYILGDSNNTNGYTGITGVFGWFCIWINDESIHAPFTAFTLIPGSLTLATNGTVFQNLTLPNGTVIHSITGSYNRHYLNSLLNISQCFYLPTIGPNGGTLTDGQPIGIYEYILNNGANLTPYYSTVMKPGNYTYWTNITVTPVLFIGPDYFLTTPITLSMVTKQYYAPLPKQYLDNVTAIPR
ncbi:MAG: hypothetical protein ACYDAO_06145 [Thermoplasmataceae archaeon]